MVNAALIDTGLQSYLNEVSKHPLLSAEEEFEVAERFYKFKRVEDAHKLVASNLRYVVKIAFEFKNSGVKLSDLIQEGNIGLMVAVKRFNPYRGFKLITYATWWIKAFMQDFILRTTGAVRRGTKALKKKLFYKKDSTKPLALPSGDGTDAVTADVSLNALIDEENGTTHLDMLRDTRPEPVEAYAEMEEEAVRKDAVSTALAVLTDRERAVIESRIMADEPESLQSIGERLGLTRERVRQIEAAALRKIKDAIAGRNPIGALPEGA